MASWDRLRGENPRQFLAFTLYRDMGPERSITKVAEANPQFSLTVLRKWQNEFNWVARTDQWDAHLDAINQRAMITEMAEQSRRRAKAFRMLLDKALLALRNVDLDKVPLNQVATAIKIAAEGMRLEQGLETQRTAVEVQDTTHVISRLPAHIRGPLLKALASDVRAGRAKQNTGGIPAGLGPDSETSK